MKCLLIFLPILFVQLTCIAQYNRKNRKDSADVTDVKVRDFTLDTTKKSALTNKLPFNKISFTDVRYDTSFIAVNWQSNNKVMFVPSSWDTKYSLKGGLAASLDTYLNYYFSNNLSGNGGEIICYIKKLIFSFKDTATEVYTTYERLNNISLEAEAYYKSGNAFYPAFRIDTTYVYGVLNIKKDFSQIVKEIISPLIQRLTVVNEQKIFTRKPYDEQQITNRYASRFNIPVLTEINKRGIFKSFEEFKNNTPSVTDFKVVTKKAGLTTLNMTPARTITFLYDVNNEVINTLHIFGFCDGATYWIQYGAFCYPLIKVGNAFEFIYSFYFKGADGNRYIAKILLPLNMENGQID